MSADVVQPRPGGHPPLHRDGAALRPRRGFRFLSLLFADKLAFVSVLFLIVLIAAVVVLPEILPQTATRMNLRARNFPPFSMAQGWTYLLGGDQLGRPILVMLLIAARTTLTIALTAVVVAMLVGSLLGLISGYYGRAIGTMIMRGADLVMSFPVLLLALIILYILQPSVWNVIIVLAVARIPSYIRVVHAEVLEIRSRLFVEAARAAGATNLRILSVHIVPIVAPTIFTLVTLDFATVMLGESSLSFLGIGVQPPGLTWGVMVSTGREYLQSAWWVAFWPGLAIVLTALATNLVASWLRIAIDPQLRWRLEQRPRAEGRPGSGG